VSVTRVRTGRATAGLRSTVAASRGSFAHGFFRVARLLLLNARLARAAKRRGPFDVVHANDFDTLLAGRRAARPSNARLVYDAHEIYADQEPDAPALYRRFVRTLEGPLARRAAAVVTVSDPIADELFGSLRLESPPIVVLNCPPISTAEPLPQQDGPLRAVYQGAMGPGRPIRDLLDALETSDEVELTIRVVGADLAELRAQIAERGLQTIVSVAEPVPPDRLVEALSGFHAGLVINRPLTRNDELVFPNKLFEYLMAGLAVIVPRLPGLASLVDAEEIGLTYEPGQPAALGAALTQLAREPSRVAAMRKRARQLALERYNAEAQTGCLLTAWGTQA
jgi:glycosyltransferase involved in cell wall biosynthesis